MTSTTGRAACTTTLSGDLGGFLIDPSRTTVTVDFLDENGATLGTGTLEPVTALDRWFSTGFIHRDTVGRIPVGTRSARVVATFDDRNPVLGNYNNAYADNLSFTVDAARPRPSDSRAAGVERRRPRSRVHGLPGEQGRRTDCRQPQRAVHQSA